MTLSSPSYFLFLLVVFVIFHLLRSAEARRWLLLAASYFFYFELSGLYIGILLLVTFTTWWGARWIRRAEGEQRRYHFSLVVLFLVASPLLAFKYVLYCLSGVFPDILTWLALPIGISFFTFVALGYIIDVYLEVSDPEDRLLRVALLLALFPLVSAGPIERATNLLPQFDVNVPLASERVLKALRLILYGLFMKLILSNALPGPINSVYDNIEAAPALARVVAVIYYSFCLYSDFAGYTLIAIGSALLFGFKVSPNFQQPFLSTTVPEFWRTWHMTLSFWVRDYIFVPLRTNWRRQRTWGQPGAVLLSFVIIGAWHGAKWGFLIFGFMHGLAAVISMQTLAARDRFWARCHVPASVVYIARVFILFIMVTLAFVPFRADNLTHAMELYRSIFSLEPAHQLAAVIDAVRHHQHDSYAYMMPFAFAFWPIPCLIVGDVLARRKVAFEQFPVIVQVVGYNYALLFIVSYWLTHYGAQPFVYYKF
jgi:alginate O-acetyltransferase complex protein AlgI